MIETPAQATEDPARQLFELADRQAGYFTAAQARALGYDYPLQHYHKEQGHWLDVGWGLYRLRDYPQGNDEELVRLTLWSRDRQGRPQAVVSHETALRLYELSDLMPAKNHITVGALNGFTPAHAFATVRTLREQGVDTPLIFMGYFNPMLRYGLERFVVDCAEAGVDGFIIPDLPPEESAEMAGLCRKYQRDLIFMVAPTSQDQHITLLALIGDSDGSGNRGGGRRRWSAART
jgi:hypothetical protein